MGTSSCDYNADFYKKPRLVRCHTEFLWLDYMSSYKGIVGFAFFNVWFHKNSVPNTPISEVSGITFWENVTARYAVCIA